MSLPPDPLFSLLDTLCRVPSWWRPAASPGAPPEHSETAVAALIAQELRRHPWLEVVVEEAAPGRPNVWARDCAEEEVELLVVGHIDTVPPSEGWSLPPHTVKDGRYHALGAADAKAAIAAALDAVGRVGPTKGVGLLLYCDEEYEFLGMKHFLAEHATVRPARALSLCGAPARVMAGCRGLLELELSLLGHPGHASRPDSGRSATLAMTAVITELAAWCEARRRPYRTVLNVAALRGGSRVPGQPLGRGAPEVQATANRIPDLAWALLELRTGAPEVTAASVRAEVDAILGRLNGGYTRQISLASWEVHLDMPGYASPTELLPPLVEPFAGVHHGRHADPGRTGYLDLALLAGRDGIPAVCMGPNKGRSHAPDEWVELASLEAYRDGMVKLLGAHGVG